MEDKKWIAFPSKLDKAVDEGKSVVVKLPCDERLWGDVMDLMKSGKVEIVIRLKR